MGAVGLEPTRFGLKGVPKNVHPVLPVLLTCSSSSHQSTQWPSGRGVPPSISPARAPGDPGTEVKHLPGSCRRRDGAGSVSSVALYVVLGQLEDPFRPGEYLVERDDLGLLERRRNSSNDLTLSW